MKILVTGCAGFIGSHLSEALLKQGHQVVGIDNFDPFYARKIKENNLVGFKDDNNFRFYELDFTKKSELENLSAENIEVIIHLAAKAGVLPSLKDPAGYIETNITGTNNILEFMRSSNIKKLLFASSSSIYGNNKEIPFKESDLVNRPISPYAFTKRTCELMNHTYHHLYGMDILNLRFFTVYGPRQRPDLAIHKFVRLIDGGEPINMYGDGSTARDYTFINDTLSGILGALDYVLKNEKVYDIINLGNNTPVKLLDLITSIYSLMQKEQNINKMPMQPGDVDITYADISKAQAMLGYNPATSLNNGLTQFINWFYDQKN